MEMYPALKAKMGTTDYYIVRMQMSEIAEKIHVAKDVYQHKALDEALQRILKEGRVKKEIVKFLNRRDRFFSSIVVAALGGKPTFSPVKISGAESENASSIFTAAKVDESFGVLTFYGGQRYYALDGQHRLAAIKALFEQNELPEGFVDDQMSVIVIVNHGDKLNATEKRKHRRIFSWLNRYAKKPSRETDIIMDEEDAFAILTRRLISDYPFFRSPSGKEDIDSSHVLMTSKNVRVGHTHFTSLQTLYDMNTTLLYSKVAMRDGKLVKLKEFITERPSDEDLDKWYNELKSYWDAILHVVPDLKNPAEKMRSDSATGKDHMFFRPIGQDMMAYLVRDLLDAAPGKDAKSALSPMRKVKWDLRAYPWRGLVSYPKEDGSDNWVMRNEERAPAMDLAYDFARHMLGIGEAQPSEMRTSWKRLYHSISVGDNPDSIWKKQVKPLLKLPQ